ncbi:hypothetical protein [Streptomyces sp. B15]|uniref:hypothetical protein n=1 Tax=Streptomyces sp. B15 TaxID=1537797 RepID=UPI001B37335D|nr:hypothetical protein [Streptomyces sp. B15]MBQ1119834.1 hypothetical protein [Streptomyces sp. B15]
MHTRIAFLGAPLLTLAYGVIRILDGLDGQRGPGLAWTAGHLVFIGAMALFIVAFAQMRQGAGRNMLSTVLAVLGSIGAVALSIQFGIDIIAGALTHDALSMSIKTAELREASHTALLAYDVGPYLFYVSQVAIVAQLAVMRRIKAWTPFLVLIDMIMPFVDKDLIPVGAVVLLISFASISQRLSEGSCSPEPVMSPRAS